MQVEEFDYEDPAGWTSLVERCGGNALHLPAIHRAEQEPSDLKLLVFQRAGEPVACCLGILTAPKGLRRYLGRARVLTLPTAPAVRDDVSDSDLSSALLAYARSNSVDRLVVQPGYSKSLCNDPELERFRSGSIVEFLLPLERDVEDICAAFHKTHRKNVRRSTRAGLQLREDSSLQGLAALRESQLVSSSRAQERAEGFGVPDMEFFGRLHEHVYGPGHGHLILAELEGRVVATLAWIAAAGRAQTVRSGSTAEGYDTRAMYFLYDALIRRCVREGIRELNCGGVPLQAADKEHAQHGLYEFKAGFGAEAFVRHGLEIPTAEAP